MLGFFESSKSHLDDHSTPLVQEQLHEVFPFSRLPDLPLSISASSTMAFSVAGKPSICNIRAHSIMISCKRGPAKVACCTTAQQLQQQQELGILCDPCQGKGWLICDFCKGEKTNVKAQNNRIYRRCPSCKSVGYVLCNQCKVYKCVTFPDYSDGEL